MTAPWRVPPVWSVAPGYRLGDGLLDSDRRGLVDQGPDVSPVVHRIAQAEPSRLDGQGLGELIMQVTVNEDALDRITALPVIREPTREALAQGQRDIGIGADQVGRIAAQLEQDRPQAGGGPDLASRCGPPVKLTRSTRGSPSRPPCPGPRESR